MLTNFLTKLTKDLRGKRLERLFFWAGGLLLVLTALAAVMGRLRLPLLRLLEGYWPWPLRLKCRAFGPN